MKVIALDFFVLCLIGFFLNTASWGQDFKISVPVKPDVPQLSVECSGWHALCNATTDCRLNGNQADCDCWRVKEIHIVVPSAIQDRNLKKLTQKKCTILHPCTIDEAPVCKAIQSGQYKVDGVKYDWVSTFSYRGWCSTFKPKACIQNLPGYQGDQNWANCMAAPCTENQNPLNPDRPLNCQCRIENSAFVGINDSCSGTLGGIMSTISLAEWNFENNTFRVPTPGYEYVRGACAPLHSDDLVE